MGWENRDWGAWSETERREFYGAHDGSGGSTEVLTPRVLVWAITGLLVFLFVAWFAYAQYSLPAVPTPRSQGVPKTIYGDPPVRMKDGQELSCVQKTVDQQTGKWFCSAYALKISPDQRFETPPPPAPSLQG